MITTLVITNTVHGIFTVCVYRLPSDEISPAYFQRFIFFSNGATPLAAPRFLDHTQLDTHKHTHTHRAGRTLLDE